MNEHHPSEPEHIEAILKASKPTADAAFQHQLEQQLLTRLHEKYETIEENTPMTKIKRKNETNRSRLPLTLVAAVMAIVLVGGFLLFMSSSSTPLNTSGNTIADGVAVSSWEQQLENCRYDLPGGYDFTYYRLRGGETLYDIARAFNVPSDEIMRANCLPDVNSLYTGTSLRIPNLMAVPTNDPFELTATQLIRKATAYAITTPTPIPTNEFGFNPLPEANGIPIMIASRAIPVGEVITEAMVYRVFWPRSIGGAVIEDNQDLGGLFGNMEDVIGMQAIVPIHAFAPIRENAIAVAADIAINRNIVPYYLPPEGFVGDYDTLGDGGDIHFSAAIPIESEADNHAVGRLEFDAFVNIGTYSRVDENGNIVTGRSGRLLVNVVYAEMLDVLRLRNIPYTYTMTLRTGSAMSIQAVDKSMVILTLPSDTPYLENIRQGDEIEIIIIATYHNTAEEEQLFQQAGLTPSTEAGEVTLIFDNLIIERIDSPPSADPINLTLSLRAEDVELLQWSINNGVIEVMQHPQDRQP